MTHEKPIKGHLKEHSDRYDGRGWWPLVGATGLIGRVRVWTRSKTAVMVKSMVRTKSGPQQAFTEFMRLDQDLLVAAAEASAPLVVTAPSDAALNRWIKAQPAADKDAWLLQVLRGDGAGPRLEMLRKFHGTSADPDADGGRTAGELLEAAEQLFAKRQEAARRREAQARR